MTYTKHDIKNSLIAAGLGNGDDVFIHSNIGFFGKCDDAKNSKELAECFYHSISDIIGTRGTIVVPTFTYSGCKNEDFDVDVTPCKMGIFSNYIMKLPDSLRSNDCNFSVSAIGGSAKYYTDNIPLNPYGDDCFFERFYSKNGKILCLNFDAGTTFVHYVERRCNVPYRKDKQFLSSVKVNGLWEERISYHFVYDLNKPEDSAEFTRLHQICIEAGIAKTATLAKGSILIESSVELYNIIEETLKVRPRFLLKSEDIALKLRKE